MEGIFKPFGYPVASECDENNQANNLRSRTRPSAAGLTRRIATVAVRLVLYVHSDQSHREPGAKG